MLQIDQIAPNKTLIFTRFYTILYSYNTPVAYYDIRENKYY